MNADYVTVPLTPEEAAAVAKGLLLLRATAPDNGFRAKHYSDDRWTNDEIYALRLRFS